MMLKQSPFVITREFLYPTQGYKIWWTEFFKYDWIKYMEVFLKIAHLAFHNQLWERN